MKRSESPASPSRCLADPDLVSQVLHQFDEPLAVARGFHADQHRGSQWLIQLLGLPAAVHQLPLPHFSRLYELCQPMTG
jgi:hypothetical protein